MNTEQAAIKMIQEKVCMDVYPMMIYRWNNKFFEHFLFHGPWAKCTGLPSGNNWRVVPDPSTPESEPKLVNVGCQVRFGEWHFTGSDGQVRSMICASNSVRFVEFSWDLPNGKETASYSYVPRWWCNGACTTEYVKGATLLPPHIHFTDGPAKIEKGK